MLLTKKVKICADPVRCADKPYHHTAKIKFKNQISFFIYNSPATSRT
jgi:hypothetical protein